MKKRIAMILMAAVLCVGLTACQKEQGPKEEIAVIDFEELVPKEQNTNEGYESFLDGEGQLYFNRYMPNSYDVAPFEIEKGYTLTELFTLVKANSIDTNAEMEINYAYLDCGNDGVNELAVRFNGVGPEGPEISTQVYVIKEIEGKLECCYHYETWSRSYTDINYYGYVTSFGSNGASNHGYDAGVIDADGNWKFVHYTEEEWDIEGLNWSQDFNGITDIVASHEYEGTIIVTTTRFEEILTADDLERIENYYAYYVDGIETDVYGDGVYKDIFNEMGVTMYHPDEIENMIQDKERALGITEEIKQGEELSWNKL